MIQDVLGYSIPAIAQDKDLLTLTHHDLRAWATDKHRNVDDSPYGGGAGMVFKPEPVTRAIHQLRSEQTLVIHPSPAAPRLTQAAILELAAADHLIFIASRYEGLDQRVIDHQVDREYSLGDFVISGGELAVAVMIDAITRILPGAIGKAASYEADSFFAGLLDYPHYTRPAVFEGYDVPEVLQNGNHEHIRRWRKRQSLARTLRFRPDLLATADLDDEARKMLAELQSEQLP